MEDFAKELKSKIDIVTLINEYVPLNKSGKSHKGLCPFHNEKTPSFMASRELQIYKCFGCSKGGDAISFIEEIEGLPFVEAMEFLARKYGLEMPRKSARKDLGPEEAQKKILQINLLASEFFHFVLKNNKFGVKILDYLKKRKVSDETVELYKIGYAPNSWDSLLKFLLKRGYNIADIAASGLVVPKDGGRGFYDRFRGRLIFPLRNERGEIVSFSGRVLGKEEPKYINGPETLVYKKDRFLFNLDLAKTEAKKLKEILLVEGYFDAITPYQEGFKNIVASSGTSLSLGQVTLIKRYCPKVVVFYDTDNAGVEAAKRAIGLLSDAGVDVRIGVLPSEFKDPDEVVRENKDTFKKAVENALEAYDFYFVYAQKNFNLKSSIGQKNASNFLVPLLSQIKHPVQKSFYAKKFGEIFDMPEDQATKIIESGSGIGFSKRVLPSQTTVVTPVNSPINLNYEEYMLSLLLKAPIEVAQKSLYKLSTEDFVAPAVKSIFVKLKEYELEKERFLIKNFFQKLDDDEKELAQKLYFYEKHPFYDKSELEEEDAEILEKDIKRVFDIINKETLKRRLKILSKEIKLAEAEKNEEKLKELEKEFSELLKKVK